MKKLQALRLVIGVSALAVLVLYVLLSQVAPAYLARAAQDLAPAGAPLAQTVSTIPQTMNYQGFLREPDGSLTTGTFDVTARIYDAASAGNQVYATTIQGVSVRDGMFEIVLGDQDALGNAFDDGPRYIGIALDGGAELIPRQRVHAVPWAMMATTAGTATTLAPNAMLPGPVSIGAGQGDLIPELVVGPPSGGRHLVVNDIPCARWGLSTGHFDLSFQNDRPAGTINPTDPCNPLPIDEWRTIMKLEDDGNVIIGEPGVVTGTLRVNGDIELAGALQYGALGDFRLMYRDDFESDFSGWACHVDSCNTLTFSTYTSCVSSDTNSCRNHILGGPGVTYDPPVANPGLTKEFDLPNGINEVMVRLTYYAIDSWDGEAAFAWLENTTGTEMGSSWFRNVGYLSDIPNHIKYIGNANFADHSYAVEMRLVPGGGDVRVFVGSLLNEPKGNESFGIDNVEVWVR